jgi:hypothetical protein
MMSASTWSCSMVLAPIFFMAPFRQNHSRLPITIIKWSIKWRVMSIEEIEAAITTLPAKDVATLMAWLEDYHARVWDKQIEEDLEAGRLDALLADVDKEYHAGLAEPL